MNFFEAQERARKSSRALVWWFALSLIGVIAVMYLLATVCLRFSQPEAHGVYGAPKAEWWDPQTFGSTFLLQYLPMKALGI